MFLLPFLTYSSPFPPTQKTKKVIRGFRRASKPNLLLFHLIQPTLKKSPNKNSTEEYFSQSEIK